MTAGAFDQALPVILRNEGVRLDLDDTGYVNNPADPGGATNFGVTQAVYDAHRRAQGQPAQAARFMHYDEAAAIYRQRYWIDGRCDLIAETHPRLALVHMDGCVNHGIRQAARFLQRAVLTDADGWIGPDTMHALRTTPEATGLESVLDQRADFYRALAARRPAMRQFLAGWLARLRHLARTTGVPIAPSFAQSS